MNVIFVDWSAGAKTMPDYDLAHQHTFLVAEVTTKLIEYLKESKNIDYDTLTVAGFSLGGKN